MGMQRSEAVMNDGSESRHDTGRREGEAKGRRMWAETLREAKTGHEARRLGMMGATVYVKGRMQCTDKATKKIWGEGAM